MCCPPRAPPRLCSRSLRPRCRRSRQPWAEIGFAEKELVFESSPVGPEKAVASSSRVGSSRASDFRSSSRCTVAANRCAGSTSARTDGCTTTSSAERSRDCDRRRSRATTSRDSSTTRASRASTPRSWSGRFAGSSWCAPGFPICSPIAIARTSTRALPYGRFVVEQLLPRVQAETPALREREATGIDGVSLGGRVALVVGFAHADRFGAIGTLQAAIQESEPRAFSRVAPVTRSPMRKSFTFVSSPAIRTTSEAQLRQLHLALDERAHRARAPGDPGPARLRFQPWSRRDRNASLARSRSCAASLRSDVAPSSLRGSW